MESGFDGVVYAMGPRVPMVKRDIPAMNTVTSTLGFRVPTRIITARAQASTTECTDARTCEKPVGSSSLALPVGLGVW